jgi:hypothetical protein
MRPFLFRCPITGSYVEELMTCDAAFDERSYVAVVCAACRRLHLVNGQTGKALGEKQA